MTSLYTLEQHDDFIDRHIGPNEHDVTAMLKTVNAKSLDDLIESTVPASILQTEALKGLIPLNCECFKSALGLILLQILTIYSVAKM